jgi:hypothetical protein
MWQDFAMLGDEFLVGYSRLDSGIVPVSLFTIGHAVELYLKATVLKIDPSFNVRRLGHRVGDTIQTIRTLDAALLANYQLRPAVYTKFMNGNLIPMAAAADPDYEHYIANQELYWISRHLADLKYLGTIHNTLPNTFAIMVRPCNPYWLTFFNELRDFLGWPIAGAFDDNVATAIAQPVTNIAQTQFLERLKVAS